MTNKSFFVFLILCGILKDAYCGNEPFSLFGLQPNKQTEMENPEFSKNQEKLSFADDAVASETTNLKKKRFFQDNEPPSEIHPDKYFLNGEYSSKRRGIQENAEEQQKLSENINMRTFTGNYWENERNRFPYSEEKENFGNSMEFRPREPMSGLNQRLDLEKSTFPEKGRPLWNGENNFGNPNSDPRVGSSFNDMPFNGNVNDYSGARDRNVLDRRISITTLNEAEMRNMNRYRGDYGINDMHSGYHQMHSNMDYNKRKDDGYWDPNPYKHDKRVIINFNTECPTSGQFNNQLVHRVIVSPKSPLTQSEISTFRLPGGGLMSSHQLTPAYYM